MKKEIFFIDDNKNILHAMKLIMHKTHFKVQTFLDPLEMLSNIHVGWDGIIVTDINMPLINGFEVLDRVKQIDSEIPVIVLTGNGDVNNVLTALRAGAYDFLEKPLSKEYLITSANRALEKRHLMLENKTLRNQIQNKNKGKGKEFLGQSDAIVRLKETIKILAKSDANVMIIGETGAGKEVVAKYIHDHSERHNNSFTAINCGAIPENLMDSELFGHEAGSFTGAANSRKGKFEETNGGTLFLDEVNSMPMSMQVKLLRFLEERVIEKIGSNKLIPVDLRIIAASQIPLKNLVNKGEFREDLYYRLNVIPIKVPALRARRDDIPLLFNNFVFEFATLYKRDIIKVEPSILNQLMDYSWPGNVRELRNAAERFVITGLITELELDQSTRGFSSSGNRKSFQTPEKLILPEKVGLYEKHLIENELKSTNGNVVTACKNLGIPRKTLYDKMKKYNVKRTMFKK